MVLAGIDLDEYFVEYEPDEDSWRLKTWPLWTFIAKNIPNSNWFDDNARIDW